VKQEAADWAAEQLKKHNLRMVSYERVDVSMIDLATLLATAYLEGYDAAEKKRMAS
jgi:hypothetical protein